MLDSYLRKVNPYSKAYKQMHEIMEEQELRHLENGTPIEGWFKKKFSTRCHPRWVRIPEKNLQKSKKINTHDPKIRLKNYPGGGF